jgi:type II secretory pathway pseudopilin PulG
VQDRGAGGFSLVELMIALSLSILAAGTLVAFSLFSSRTLLATSNRMDLESQSRTALDIITKEMRSTIELKECKTNSITFTDFNKKQTKFEYDAGTRQLIWVKEGKPKDVILLNGCDNITFALFDRAPSSGTYDLTPVTDPKLCKAVGVSMRSSRTFTASKIQAMNTVSATVVLRMK